MINQKVLEHPHPSHAHMTMNQVEYKAEKKQDISSNPKELSETSYLIVYQYGMDEKMKNVERFSLI